MVTPPEVFVFVIVFGSALTQGLTGFGFGLVAVPLLQLVLGMRSTLPLVTLISSVVTATLFWSYRQQFQLKPIVRLSLASLCTIPLGVFSAQFLAEDLLRTGLAVVLISYSSYALLQPQLPPLIHPSWAYLFGSLSGLLTGASNVGGPPVVIYAQCQRWDPHTFKSNLQAFFLLTTASILLSRGIQGSYTPEIWRLFVLCLPAVGLGIATGLHCSQFLDPHRFRIMVLWFLIALGLLLLS
jgi:hypothetical protein